MKLFNLRQTPHLPGAYFYSLAGDSLHSQIISDLHGTMGHFCGFPLVIIFNHDLVIFHWLF